MAAEDRRVASIVDPHGRQIVLLARIWEEKITRDHPELADHLDAVVEIVTQPDHIESEAIPRRTRFYRRAVGPQLVAARGRKL